MKKYKKFAEIFSKYFENHGFLVYHPFNNGHVTGPKADKFSIIVLNLFRTILIKLEKNLIDCICRFFSRLVLRLGGWYQPQKSLTDKTSEITNLLDIDFIFNKID